MWWYLIPGAFSALALLAIGAILHRAFPRLVIIDITTIAGERDAARKRQIVFERAERLRASFFQTIKAILRPRVQAIGERVRAWYARAVELEKRHRIGGATPEGAIDQVKRLVQEAVDFKENGQFRRAEERLLQAIHLMPRFAKAYEELGRLYVREQQWSEAREAFRFLFKLDPNDASAHANMGELEVARGLPMEAIVHFEKAVKLKPANPRLQALLLDAAISAQAKDLAVRTFAQLKELVPQFPDIEKFEERIRRM